MGDQVEETMPENDAGSMDAPVVEQTSCTAFKLALTKLVVAAEDESEAETGDAEEAEGTAAGGGGTLQNTATDGLPDTLIIASTFLGERALSAPATKREDGTYEFEDFSHVFLCDACPSSVQNSVLRGELTLDICDAATAEEGNATPLGRASVDLLPLLSGEVKVGGDSVRFEALATLEDEAAGVTALPSATQVAASLEAGVMTFTTKTAPRADDADETEDDAAPQTDAEDDGIRDEGSFTAKPLMSPEEADENIVVSLNITAISPVPTTAIIGALGGNGDDDDSEAVSTQMVIASHVPCTPVELQGEQQLGFTAVCASFTVDSATRDEAVEPKSESGCRTAVPGSFKDVIVQKLLSKQPLVLEMVPASETSLSYSARQALHAIATGDLSPLLEPGSTQLAKTVAFDVPATPGVTTLSSCLPPATSSEQEQAPDEGEAGTTATLWSESSIHIELSLSSPIIPPWEAPGAPSTTVDNLIPARTVEPLEGRGLRDFGVKIEEISKQISDVYVTSFSSKPGGDDVNGNTLSESEKINRRRALIYELNRSGAYMSMKESLKSSVVAIVHERFNMSGGMSREEMSAVYNDLYVMLSENAHAVLNGMTTSLPKPSALELPTPDTEELLRLKSLADELEVQGDITAASAHHQARLAAATDSVVWYDYGCFCMRTGERAKAEECFRESLQCDGDNVGSLLLLAALLVSDGILEQAEVYAYKAAVELEQSPRTWSLLALIYEDLGKRKETDNSVYMAKKLAGDAGGAAALDLTLLLLDAHCHELASRSLELAIAGGAALGDDTDALLCQARCDELGGRAEEAGASLRRASEASPGNSKVLIMLGKHYAAQACMSEAIAALEAALKAADGAIPLDAYMRLGELHAESGNYAVARVRYLDACRSNPCCSTWLGAGIASYRLGLLHDAEMCLAEANVLDNFRPAVWAHLALVSMAAGRPTEAAEAVRLAIQKGVRDATVLTELGDSYRSAGQTTEAIRMYKLATKCTGGSSGGVTKEEVHVKLADALVSTRDFQRARAEVLASLKAMSTLDSGDMKTRQQDIAARAAELLATCDAELGIIAEMN